MGILCRVTAIIRDEFAGKTIKNSEQTGAMAIVEISSKEGSNTQLVISRSQDILLELGDKIKCLTGKAAVEINHATLPVTHIISERPPTSSGRSLLKSVAATVSKIANEIEITDGVSVTLIKEGNAERVTNDMVRMIRSSAATMSKFGKSINR
jgi:hypothetical protein